MNCPKCNAQLMPNAKFCGSCGYTLQVQSPQQPQQAIRITVQHLSFSLFLIQAIDVLLLRSCRLELIICLKLIYKASPSLDS